MVFSGMFLSINFNLGSQDEISEEHYKDSTQILQMLRDHLTQWTSAVDSDSIKSHATWVRNDGCTKDLQRTQTQKKKKSSCSLEPCFKSKVEVDQVVESWELQVFPAFWRRRFSDEAHSRWMSKKYMYLNSSSNSQPTSLFSTRNSLSSVAWSKQSSPIFASWGGQLIRSSPLQSPTFQWTRAQGSWSKSVLKGRAKTKTPKTTPAALVSFQRKWMWCLKKL